MLAKRGCGDGDQIRYRIELHERHLSVMTVQSQQGLRDVLRRASFGELPQLAINRE